MSRSSTPALSPYQPYYAPGLLPLETKNLFSDKRAPIRALVRYMKNRPGQFEYKTAIDQQLPIGSGKIESAHRSLIQKRPKNTLR